MKKYEDMNAIELFFHYLSFNKMKLIEIINSYITRNGIAINDCIAYAYAEEYEEYEEGYFGKYGLKIVIQEPIVNKEKEEIYEIEEFLQYIIKYYKNNYECYSDEEKEIIEAKLKLLENSKTV